MALPWGPLLLHLVTAPITAETVTCPDWSWLMVDPQPPKLSRPARNKNPGNLKSLSLVVARRLYGKEAVVGLDDERHVQFATWEAGLAALRQDLRVKVSGRSRTGLPPNPTIAAFSKVYAQDPKHGRKLALLLSTTPEARIGKDVQEEAFLRALIRREGGSDTWAAVAPLLPGEVA